MSRIDNSLVRPLLERPQGTQNVAASPRRVDAPAPLATSPVTHTPAPEVLEALGNLRQIPEVREDLVQQVSRRFLAGELQTPAVIERTAAAILTAAAGPSPAPDLTAPAPADAHAEPVDLQKLLDTLRDIPVLRQEIVAEVAQRLASGQLTTLAAAQQTVNAIQEIAGRGA